MWQDQNIQVTSSCREISLVVFEIHVVHIVPITGECMIKRKIVLDTNNQVFNLI